MDIIFPPEIVLSAITLNNVRGVGLFGALRDLTGTIDTATNTYSITDGCRSYTTTDHEATVDFMNIVNAVSTKPST